MPKQTSQTRSLDFIGYGIGAIAPKLASLALVPVITAGLNKQEFGQYHLAETIGSIVVTIIACGLPAAVVRTWAKPEEDSTPSQRIATLLILLFITLFVLGPLLLSVGYLLWPHLPFVAELPFYLVVVSVIGGGAQQFLQALKSVFQAQSRAWMYGLFAAIFSIATYAVTAYLIVERQWTAVAPIAGRGVAAGATIAIALLVVLPTLRGRPSRALTTPLLLFSVPLVAHQLVSFLLTAGDRFVIEHFIGIEEVGVYSLAYSFGAMIGIVTMVVSLVWTPRFFATVDRDPEGVAKNTMFLAAGTATACTVGMLAAPWLLTMLSDAKFHNAAPLVPIIVGGYFYHSLFSLFCLPILHVGRTARLARVTVFAAVANMVLNMLLVPVLASTGAAGATMIAYMLEALLVFKISQKLLHLPHKVGEHVGLAAGILIVCVLSVVSPSWLHWGASFIFVAILSRVYLWPAFVRGEFFA